MLICIPCEFFSSYQRTIHHRLASSVFLVADSNTNQYCTLSCNNFTMYMLEIIEVLSALNKLLCWSLVCSSMTIIHGLSKSLFRFV